MRKRVSLYVILSFSGWSFLFFSLKSTDKRIKLFEFELVFDSLKARSRLICEEYYLIICEELWVSLIISCVWNGEC